MTFAQNALFSATVADNGRFWISTGQYNGAYHAGLGGFGSAQIYVRLDVASVYSPRIAADECCC